MEVIMGKVESTIKGEIMRLAKREVRGSFFPLRREVYSLRLKLSGLIRSFTAMERQAKEVLQEQAKKKLILQATPEEVKISRLTPQRIRLLRNKIGISQKDVGTLLDVSIGTIGMWEKGKFAPSAQKKAALIALRKLGKREVKKLLAEKKQGLKEKSGKAVAKKPAGKKAAAARKKPAKAKPARKK
jgi:DNA-binding transcriptional regulator YiaG